MEGRQQKQGGLTHHLNGPGGGDSGSALTYGGLLLSLKRDGGHRLFLLLLLFFSFLQPCWHCSNVLEIGARKHDYQTLVCRAESMSVGQFCSGVNEDSNRG